MRALLEHDAAITAEFDLQDFDYETALGAVPVIGRLPTLDEAGKSLAARLETELVAADGSERYIDVTLVGHSMGGLIIQAALLSLLTPQGSARTLDRVRQVILFATPNFGSTTLGRLRALLDPLLANPQERALRLFSESSVRIHESIRDRVILARKRARDEYPIPFYCFWGRTDGVVRAESALGHCAAGEPLPGDHFAVHSPGDANAPAYRQFVAALASPHGHLNIWEVERFEMSVKVSPAAPGTEVTAHHGGKQRRVVYDNVATIRRRVTFSRYNRCQAPFVLKYGTRNDGWVVPRISEPHITPADKLRFYDDNGVDAYYEVEPTPGTTSTLDLTVYKGFDAGQRDYHMHLGRSTYFRRILFTVDLSDYRRDGWEIDAPRLFFHPTDPGDHLLCGQRQMINPDPPHTVDPAGVWRWDLEFVKEGVVDIVWDVRQRDVASSPAPTTIQLAPGEHAVFGYGPLLSVASLERTLGRRYDGPFVVSRLEGWRRRWNVAMPNDAFVYREGETWVQPSRIFYLNVEPEAGRSVNGILFVVTEAELLRLDAREWIYDRVDVTSMLGGVSVTGGTVWAYSGKPQHVFEHPASPREGAIRRTYLDILDQGQRQLGERFAVEYASTTDGVPPALVVKDVRRDDAI
jgi:pimeloyl-ACP methyl ester carboxylesterase